MIYRQRTRNAIYREILSGSALLIWLTSHMSRWAGDGITYPFPNLGITCDHAVTHFVLYWYGIYKLEIQVLVLSDYLIFFSTFDKRHISLLGFVAKRWIMKYIRLLPDLIAWICFTCSDTTCMPWIASLKGLDKGQGWGLLKLRSSVFSASKIFGLAKVPATFFESYSHLTSVTAADRRRHLSNMNVIFNG